MNTTIVIIVIGCLILAIIATLRALTTEPTLKPTNFCEECGKGFTVAEYEPAIRILLNDRYLCDSCFYILLNRKCAKCGTQPVVGTMYHITGVGDICNDCHTKK